MALVRRLVQHALVGVGFTALTASAAVAGFGGAGAQATSIAVPAAVVTTSVPTARPTASTDAERAARQAEQTRSASRAQLTSARAQAIKRSAALTQQSRAITREQARIEAAEQAKTEAAEQARAEAREAREAREERAAEASAERERAADERARARADASAAARAEATRAAEAEAEAQAQAAAAAAAARRVADQQGYEPGTTDPREMARQILQNKFGYGPDQFSCFNDIIIRESNWDIDATNPSSGAYGIPQALPGTKMASVADDWRTNPATQIVWAVGYMDDRYGSPCQAWGFWSANNWY